MFGRLTPEEIERRHALSVEAVKKREREEFALWYQEICDTEYWAYGQCCAGCDFWQSDAGNSGRCTAAAPVSGVEVMRSMHINSSSYQFEPGHPFTRNWEWCGQFRDEFDWSQLGPEYLRRIGAFKDGKLKPKPKHSREA